MVIWEFWILRLTMVYLFVGEAATESVTLVLSGFVLMVVTVSIVVDGALWAELSIAVESVLFVDIEDSLVPQLTANNPIIAAINNDFFIILYFVVSVLLSTQKLFRNNFFLLINTSKSAYNLLITQMSNYIVCFEMSSSITFTDEVRL